MCGIGGTVGFADGATKVQALSQELARRGPDDCDQWSDHDVALGHRRLSIIGLTPAGRNPMWNETRDVALVFNGEIFNYESLRAGLLERGHRFSSETDSEVVVHLYEELGEELCSRLDGMYAFALWDAKRRILFAARDPFGEKPFYYQYHGKQFAFASTVDSLVRAGIAATDVVPEEIANFLLFGASVAPATMLRSVRALAAGHRLRFEADSGALSITSARTASHFAASAPTTAPLLEWRHLVDAVDRRMIADVPVGVFLSGGIDSTSVAAAMRERVTGRLLSFSIGYESQHGAFDETDDALIAAKLIETEHHVDVITADDFVASLDDILLALDLPSHDGVNAYFAARLASRHVKVAMTGVGGDELFGGYSTFRYEWASRQPASALGRFAGRVFAPVARELAARAEHAGATKWPLLLLEQGANNANDTLSRWMQVRRLTPPDEVRAFVHNAGLNGSGPSGLRSRIAGLLQVPASLQNSVSLLECVGYMTPVLLRDADAVSMHHGLELRVPFLDRDLVNRALGYRLEQLVGIHGGKDPLRRIVRGHVPARTLEKRKQGFGMPLGWWLRDPRVRSAMNAAVGDATLVAREVLNFHAVEREFRAFHEAVEPPPVRRVMRVWMLFSLLRWFRRLEGGR